MPFFSSSADSNIPAAYLCLELHAQLLAPLSRDLVRLNCSKEVRGVREETAEQKFIFLEVLLSSLIYQRFSGRWGGPAFLFRCC